MRGEAGEAETDVLPLALTISPRGKTRNCPRSLECLSQPASQSARPSLTACPCPACRYCTVVISSCMYSMDECCVPCVSVKNLSIYLVSLGISYNLCVSFVFLPHFMDNFKLLPHTSFIIIESFFHQMYR